MSKKWFLWLAPAILLLTGCDENYRYPCQDPENWGQKICQKPYCSANGTCPEDLTHYEKDKTAGTSTKQVVSPQITNKGGCDAR
jgi:hypothetical protein